jgi:beta-lactamase regulating signal transducer with metallopeptidase domain
MHRSNLSRLAGNLLLAISLLIVPFAAQIFAQGNTSTTTSSQTSAPSTQSSQQTTTTTSKTTVPTETTRTTTTTTVDPLWIAVGVVALLAILAIAFLAMRGRSRDTVAVSTERETTVKRD